MLSRARTDANTERDSAAQSPRDCGSNRRQQYQALVSETHLPSSSPEKPTALARPKCRGTRVLGRSSRLQDKASTGTRAQDILLCLRVREVPEQDRGAGLK